MIAASFSRNSSGVKSRWEVPSLQLDLSFSLTLPSLLISMRSFERGPLAIYSISFSRRSLAWVFMAVLQWREKPFTE